MNRDQSAILEEEEEGIGDMYPNTILVFEGFKLCHLGGTSTSMLQAENIRMNRSEERQPDSHDLTRRPSHTTIHSPFER